MRDKAYEQQIEDIQLAMKMLGFRNVLVHDYLEVNRSIVESIVQNGFYKDVCRITRELKAVM